jgi:hypothetical protein
MKDNTYMGNYFNTQLKGKTIVVKVVQIEQNINSRHRGKWVCLNEATGRHLHRSTLQLHSMPYYRWVPCAPGDPTEAQWKTIHRMAGDKPFCATHYDERTGHVRATIERLDGENIIIIATNGHALTWNELAALSRSRS